MNFSDETVEKCEVAVAEELAILPSNTTWEDRAERVTEAALSSLTLADLMQVDAVWELVDRLIQARDFVPEGEVIYIDTALKPFTEAK